jgi:hypothetical protein
LWPRNLRSLKWGEPVPLLSHLCSLAAVKEGAGQGGLYVAVDIMEILSVASSLGDRHLKGGNTSKSAIGPAFFFFLFAVLGFEHRAYTLSHSTSLFL